MDRSFLVASATSSPTEIASHVRDTPRLTIVRRITVTERGPANQPRISQFIGSLSGRVARTRGLRPKPAECDEGDHQCDRDAKATITVVRGSGPAARSGAKAAPGTLVQTPRLTTLLCLG